MSRTDPAAELPPARDTTAENREFFKNELAGAIRDIRAEYDNQVCARPVRDPPRTCEYIFTF